MTVQQARKKLISARKRANKAVREISELRQFIFDAGEDPDPNKAKRLERNKTIYKQWKGGEKFIRLAEEYRLSPTTIGSICKRIDRSLEVKNSRYEEYKDLLRYKDGTGRGFKRR